MIGGLLILSLLFSLRTDWQLDSCWGSAPNPEVYPLGNTRRRKTAVLYRCSSLYYLTVRVWALLSVASFLTAFLVLTFYPDKCIYTVCFSEPIEPITADFSAIPTRLIIIFHKEKTLFFPCFSL